MTACLLLAAPRAAWAVPAFARKYETSCQTCHVVFPKLTPFGEAFRRNGYRFPEKDDEMVKQEPLPLGQDVQKSLWPRAVWPGEVPSGVPLSAMLSSSISIRPEEDAELVFDGMSVGLNVAGTLGSRFSVWAGVEVEGEPGAAGGEETRIDHERVFAIVSAFERPYLNFRIGELEPQVLGFTVHRMLGLAPWITTTRIRDNRFALDPRQHGIEATGVVGSGRIAYALGVVEGAGNLLNTEKDVYARLSWKWGGMRLDGVGGGAQKDPWRETSVQVGAFAYGGFANIGDPVATTQDDRFLLAGADAEIQLGDATLIAAYAYGANERPLLADPSLEFRSHQVLAQLDYVVFPWLVPTLRYESRVIEGEDEDRFSSSIYFLPRANVRLLTLVGVERAPDDDLMVRIQASLSAAF